MNKYSPRVEASMIALYKLLDESNSRRYAAVEALKFGYGGKRYIKELFSTSYDSINKGIRELSNPSSIDKTRIRKVGGGAKSKKKDPVVQKTFETVISNHQAGNPEDMHQKWTYLNQEEIVAFMASIGMKVSRSVVKGLLKLNNYVKRKSQKLLAGGSGENRNEQFENIASKRASFYASNDPVLSMDTKKKELIGAYSRGKDALYGKEAEATNDHDFKKKGGEVGIPHALYDDLYKQGYIMIGNSHDTSEFACYSIKRWWEEIGQYRYPDAKRMLLTCDGGGSNNSRHYIFKDDLQKLAIELGIDITIAHYPPYCSKWNPIEHRLFPHISNALNRGAKINDIEHMAQKIRRTKTKTGLSVDVFTTNKEFKTGRKYTEGFKENNQIVFDEYLSKWNYTAKANP